MPRDRNRRAVRHATPLYGHHETAVRAGASTVRPEPQAMTTDMTTDDLFALMRSRGNGRYGLSDVSQLEHALQSAALAAERQLGDALVIAALFHDLGHLLVGDDVDLAEQGIDDVHEETSAGMLATIYGPAVAEPVRLH